MPFEQVYISAAIQTFTGIVVFLFLYWTTDNEKLKKLWLVSTFIVLTYGFGVQERGFRDLDNVYAWSGGTTLSSVTFTLMQGLQWIFIILVAVMVFDLFKDFLYYFWNTVISKKPQDYKG